MTEPERMLCAYCGHFKDRRDGFPSPLYPECWSCFWRGYNARHNPPPRRRFLRLGSRPR